jgi:hypothetical protein
MKINIVQGVDEPVTIDVPEGATVSAVLGIADVITLCGEHGSARVNGTEVPVDAPLKDGDTFEPVSKANEKACDSVEHGAARDEHGRFAKKDEAPVEEQKEVPAVLDGTSKVDSVIKLIPGGVSVTLLGVTVTIAKAAQ